jgi:hypothetical protein
MVERGSRGGVSLFVGAGRVPLLGTLKDMESVSIGAPFGEPGGGLIYREL